MGEGLGTELIHMRCSRGYSPRLYLFTEAEHPQGEKGVESPLISVLANLSWMVRLSAGNTAVHRIPNRLTQGTVTCR